MPEITIIIDDVRGELTVEDNQALGAEARNQLVSRHGTGLEHGCAKPRTVLALPAVAETERAGQICARINGLYHDSLTEGPGRRSSVLLQGCPLKCKNCWVTHLHSEAAGALIPVAQIAELLLDPKFERDGVSILGGEPFAQPDALLALVRELRSRGCPHIVCYSGYTLEALRERAIFQPVINSILDEIDILIDGAFVESQSLSAGAWTGSGNQRVIEMDATKAAGRIVLYDESGAHGEQN